MARKGKKPSQPFLDEGIQDRRRPSGRDIGICIKCGWRKYVKVVRGRYNRFGPVGPMTAHMSPIQIGCPVCALAAQEANT